MKPDFNILEQDIRTDFKSRWIGWLTTYQPGKGATMGIPDTQIMARPPMIESIEMKRGYVNKGRLFCDEIRPAQVAWHTTLSMSGGKSWFYVGVNVSGNTERYLIPAPLMLVTRYQGLVIGAGAVRRIDITTNRKGFDPIFTSCLKDALG